jgi:hypothetical protein
MHNEWLAMEHYRIHVMELWPDGPKKEAGLGAARFALGSLGRTVPKASSFACTACASRRKPVTMISYTPQFRGLPSGLAA